MVMSPENTGLEITDAEVDADGNTVFKRKDTELFEAVVNQLIAAGVGKAGKLPVPTGELNKKGRGKSELSDAKTLQGIANQKGYGLRISARHRQDGMTVLRMAIVPKRTFTSEQIANREKGQNRRRLELARGRVQKATAALALDANDVAAKAMLDEATNRIAELEGLLKTRSTKPVATK